MQFPPGTVVYYLVEPDSSQQLSGLPISPIPSSSPPTASPPAGSPVPFGSLPPGLPIAPPGCHYVYGPPGTYIAFQLICDGLPTPGSPPAPPAPGVPPSPPLPLPVIPWTILVNCVTLQLAAVPSATTAEISQLVSEGWCTSPQFPVIHAATTDQAIYALENNVGTAQQLCITGQCPGLVA